jgi:four helix bundle protein
VGHSYRDLVAWQKAMLLVTKVYRLSESFPKNEMYGLTSQMRRAAISVPSNIAEGQGRSFDREFSRFLSIALGSLMELETQLQIAVNLGYVSQTQTNQLLQDSAEIGRIVNGLIGSIRRTLGD